MRRVRVQWNGLNALPGLSTFYYGVASPNVSDLVTFFTAIKALFPTGLTWTIPSSGDEIDDATGALTGGWVGSGGGTVAATATSAGYPAGVGARLQWNTGVVYAGRRVKGGTFLAPLYGNAYESNGTLTTAAIATMQTAADAWVASGVAKGVWSRPVVDPDRPARNRPGLYAAISSCTIADRVTSLRTRRY